MTELCYLSVCSGIEAVSVAWHPLGFRPVAFAEIEPFPCAVLKHHYPGVPNWGDLTKFKDWPDAAFDVLVGGTPCQSFSVAGLRAGLADPRGNLALTYLAVVDRYRPRWVVWENVPGVLSADDGGALGAFLGGLAELGYGFAYRVLDAQYFGLAQRRARVFVVGHLGDWRRAAAVLFERESLSGHPPPRREAGEGTSRRTSTGLESGVGQYHRIYGDDEPIATLQATGSAGGAFSHAVAVAPIRNIQNTDKSYGVEDGTGRGTPIVAELAPTLDNRAGRSGANSVATSGGLVAEPFTLAIRGRDDSHDLEYRRDGTANAVLTPNGGRGGIGVGAIAFSAKDHGADAGEQIAPTLRAGGHDGSHANGGVMPAVAFDWQSGGDSPGLDPKNTAQLQRCQVPALHRGMQVRRLTPQECERLQGFPDDYTLIPYRGKPAVDGPRYKALGNSMAVPVMAWIGGRIALVDALPCSQEQTA